LATGDAIAGNHLTGDAIAGFLPLASRRGGVRLLSPCI
jgi:hypothetical protein